MTPRLPIDPPAPGAPSPPPRFKWLLVPAAAAALVATAPLSSVTSVAEQQQAQPNLARTIEARLSPTPHAAVPATLETMWYARPERALPATNALAGLARGVKMLDESGDAAAALPLVSAASLAKSEVGEYSRYYTGIALQRLNRLDDADAAFATVAALDAPSVLPEAALFRQAEIREARGDYAGAVAIYERLLQRKLASPQIALVKLAAAASAAGDGNKSIEAARRVVTEFTLAAEAAEAELLLERRGGFTLTTPAQVAAELDRAEALFKARKWEQARAAFERVKGKTTREDEERPVFRLAQIDAATGQIRPARDVFKRYVGHATFAAEAAYGLIQAERALGSEEAARDLTQTFITRFPSHPLGEAALNEMARQYILSDEDDRAAEVYVQMTELFPQGPFAERAFWKAGWWAYREKNFRDTVQFFEHGARRFPRSDYRPSWLYWSARAYDQLGDATNATERYRLAATDYRNTYYGRLAWERLEARKDASLTPGFHRAIVTAPPPPGNAARISRLIELGLYRPALNELQYAQKVWGDSPQLQATLGLVHNRLGNLRLGINAMKRAYPQYMAAGGEALPVDILHVLFPIDYWPLLKGHAQAKGLDPYIVAALVAQESTFDAGIRSSANAIGLMQLLPSTGRRYARKMGIRSFSERTLTTAETNVQLGTQYYSELIERFGAAHLALASYNAGEHRVQRWVNETPNLPQDEFIDNIPFPETQNYVKRILGTAEDYRRLYGDGAQTPQVTRPATKAPARKTVSPTKRPPAKQTPAKRTTRPASRPPTK
jgi:soluble lytic murein transglycosylase